VQELLIPLHLGTELVAILDSPDFPPISIIDNFMPNFLQEYM
jgi:hypothetical protein